MRDCICDRSFSLYMHAKPSFAHRLQAATMAFSRTGAQNNGPRAQNNGSRAQNDTGSVALSMLYSTA